MWLFSALTKDRSQIHSNLYLLPLGRENAIEKFQKCKEPFNSMYKFYGRSGYS